MSDQAEHDEKNKPSYAANAHDDKHNERNQGDNEFLDGTAFGFSETKPRKSEGSDDSKANDYDTHNSSMVRNSSA